MTNSTTVIGAGSVGLGVAASLALAGQKVTLLARSSSVAALKESDLTVSGLHGEHTVSAGTIRVEDSAAPSDAARGCDMLVVTTKALDLAGALRPFLTPGAKPKAILSMQNGLGPSETIRAEIGPDIPVFASVMMIGYERQGLSHVAITAAASPISTGPLLGDDPGPLESFVMSAQNGFLPIQVDPNIRETVFFKLLFNTCMNPTGALTGLTYGELVSNAHTLGLIENLAQETFAVLDAEAGYRPAKDASDYVHNILSPAVLAKSAGHRSSMVQDMESGRRTEIDTLNGAIAGLGRKLGIPTPTHDVIVALIKAQTG